MSDFESYEPESYQENETKSVLGEAFVADESFSNFTSDINKEEAMETDAETCPRCGEENYRFNESKGVKSCGYCGYPENKSSEEKIAEKYARITEELSFGQDRKTYKRLSNLPTVKDEDTGSKGLVQYNDQPNKELGLWYVKFKKDLGYNSALETDPEEEMSDRLRNMLKNHPEYKKGNIKFVNLDEEAYASEGNINQSYWDGSMNIFDKLGLMREIGGDATDRGLMTKWDQLPEDIRQKISQYPMSYRIKAAPLGKEVDELNYEDTEFGSNRDGKIEPFDGKPESEDAVKSAIDEVNFAEELDMSSLYNSDIYRSELPERKEEAQESVVDLSLQDKQGREGENEIESKIINRKLNGYGEEAIAKELYVWHDMEREQSIPLIRSIEVNTDDRAAYTLFGKRLHMLDAREIDELKNLSGF